MVKQKSRAEIVREFLREAGRKGGQTRAKNLSKEELSRIGKMGGRPVKGGKKR